MEDPNPLHWAPAGGSQVNIWGKLQAPSDVQQTQSWRTGREGKGSYGLESACDYLSLPEL